MLLSGWICAILLFPCLPSEAIGRCPTLPAGIHPSIRFLLWGGVRLDSLTIWLGASRAPSQIVNESSLTPPAYNGRQAEDLQSRQRRKPGARHRFGECQDDCPIKESKAALSLFPSWPSVQAPTTILARDSVHSLVRTCSLVSPRISRMTRIKTGLQDHAIEMSRRQSHLVRPGFPRIPSVTSVTSVVNKLPDATGDTDEARALDPSAPELHRRYRRFIL